MVKVNNIIQKKQRNLIGTFNKEDGSNKNPGEETLNTITTHFPSATKQINKKHTSANSFSRNYIMSKNKDWITVPKPGKKNYNIPKAFRPISLSNYFLKTLERLVCWKLEDDPRSNPLHEAQHGFTKNKSTESAAASVVNYVEKHIYIK